MNDELENLEKDLLKKVPQNYKDEVLEAISWVKVHYEGHNRLSGENTIYHALRVANTVGDLHLDTDSILVAILHCLPDYKDEKMLNDLENDIKKKFGQNVLDLLNILKKINQGTDSAETERKTITRYVLSNSEDIRGILIKLCDVLEDVKTIEYLPPELIKQKTQKVYDIYAPLCSYLNLESIRRKLEGQAFRFTKPEEYHLVAEKMEKEGLNEELLNRYIAELSKSYEILDYKPTIFGRIKSKYSMYNKLKKLENEGKGTALAKIKDRVALTMITKNVDDCFLLKMHIEENAIVDEEETDDYINNPKPNGYQALQMSVKFPDIKDIFVEIQMLTDQMYYVNRYGPASHLAYKASKTRFAKASDAYNWIEDLHKKILHCQSSSQQERSVPIKTEIFKNYIYIFTPKGRIIELPKNATALDFAYRVHTKIGHKAMFATVDDEHKDLSTVLETGSVVNIITSNEDKYPNRDWLKFAASDSTKEKIRRALREKANLKQ
jgi:GTP diphosphokinase / guanosine-3',5'-bis(diphosphate) 3'-diphosphatase